MEHTTIKDLRVAGILDELSSYFFIYECDFLNLDIDIWKEQMNQFKPELLFVESAWKGREEKWYKKVSTPSEELKGVIEWCHTNHVPTVFWNKEDPVHFSTFLQTAFLFDWVFTTDMDCIPLYKRLLHHNQVGLLPFAACTYLFNPIESYDRKMAVSFAGAYYRLQKERTKDFTQIYEACEDMIPFEIYDRNPYNGHPDYTYPDKYKGVIQGTLPVNEIEVAYKNYLFSLTMNTVKNSSTMEARRVFELLASNTITVSNDSQGVTNLFGDLVLTYKEKEQFQEQLNLLIEDQERYNKQRVLALRKVLKEHTYHHRMIYLAKKVLGRTVEDDSQDVLIFSTVSSQEEADQIYKMYTKQTYGYKQLVLITKDSILVKDEVKVVSPTMIKKVSDLGNASYYSFFSVHNYYGANFILDCMLTREYGNYPVIGKGTYFYKNGKEIIKVEEQKKYRISNQVRLDRCVFSEVVARNRTYQSSLETQVVCGYETMLIDEYNFCEGLTKENCSIVDDMVMHCGYSMDEVYERVEQLAAEQYYTIQKTLTGTEIVTSIITKNRPEIVKKQSDTNKASIINCSNVERLLYLYSDLIFSVKEYCQTMQLRVYLRGNQTGTVKFTIDYRDDMNQDIKRFYVPVNSYAILPVPDKAVTFCINPILGSNSTLEIEEVCFNAISQQAIQIK